VDKHGSRLRLPGRTLRTADGHEALPRPRRSLATIHPDDMPQLRLDLDPEP